VFTSLMNAGYAEHDGRGEDAVVYLTDLGVSRVRARTIGK